MEKKQRRRSNSTRRAKGTQQPKIQTIEFSCLRSVPSLFKNFVYQGDEECLLPTQSGALAHLMDRSLETHLLALKATQPKNIL